MDAIRNDTGYAIISYYILKVDLKNNICKIVRHIFRIIANDYYCNINHENIYSYSGIIVKIVYFEEKNRYSLNHLSNSNNIVSNTNVYHITVGDKNTYASNYDCNAKIIYFKISLIYTSKAYEASR